MGEFVASRPIADSVLVKPANNAGASRAVERENRELRKAQEVLRLASSYFSQAALDRRIRS